MQNRFMKDMEYPLFILHLQPLASTNTFTLLHHHHHHHLHHLTSNPSSPYRYPNVLHYLFHHYLPHTSPPLTYLFSCSIRSSSKQQRKKKKQILLMNVVTWNVSWSGGHLAGRWWYVHGKQSQTAAPQSLASPTQTSDGTLPQKDK